MGLTCSIVHSSDNLEQQTYARTYAIMWEVSRLGFRSRLFGHRTPAVRPDVLAKWKRKVLARVKEVNQTIVQNIIRGRITGETEWLRLVGRSR
jgi:hypothetical protein